MNALPIIVVALCVIAIAYRYYSAFIAAKVLALDDSRPVPSQTMYDGHNYYPTNKWVLFGHHFAAISGAGPLIGPVLAAQFGFLPGLLWLVIGVCLGGAVHDFMILGASIRRKGKSLAEIALTEISPISGFVAGVAILFIVVIALAGLGLVVVNALAESPWGTFTVGFTIPLALLMGLYMYAFAKGASSKRVSSESSDYCSRFFLAARSPIHPGRKPSRSRATRSSSSWPRMDSSPRCCRFGCCFARAITCRHISRLARSPC